MPLLLKPVEPARGVRWVKDAFALYARRPMAFTLMFVAFLGAAIVASLVPYAGGVLQMMMLPLLSLGFMVASQSALLDGPVSPQHFIDPLRGDPKRRKSLLVLCALYAACAIGILLLCDEVSNHAMQRFQALVMQGTPSAEQLTALAAEPAVGNAVLLGTVLGSLLTVPFWHAPALVHWGGQGMAQALFSSTLALWRCKGAFTVYMLVWTGVVAAFSLLAAPLLSALGAGAAIPMLALAAMLLIQTVFYISLLFTFNDSFGGSQGRATDFNPLE